MRANRRLTATRRSRTPEVNTASNTRRNHHKKSTRRRVHIVEKYVRRDPEIYQCRICTELHSIRFCRHFLKMTVKERQVVVKNYKYCQNCLAKSHEVRSCSSLETCKWCDKRHHTLLHSPYSQQPTKQKGVLNRQQRHQRPKPQVSRQATSSAVPNTKVIVDAIKALALVLSN